MADGMRPVRGRMRESRTFGSVRGGPRGGLSAGQAGKTVKYETTLNCASCSRPSSADPANSAERCCVLTSLPPGKRNVVEMVMYARCCWNVEECFRREKDEHGGYCLKHASSRNGSATKNHCLLIQISHAISQVTDAWHVPRVNDRDNTAHVHAAQSSPVCIYLRLTL